MAWPIRAQLPPALVGALGSLVGVTIAWGLAGQGFYLVWALASALLLFALSQRFPASTSTPNSKAWVCGSVLRNAAGLLLTVAWLDGPSPLALMTAFWAQRLFAEWRPTALQFLTKRGGEFSDKMADLVPALWAFLLVMLPLRVWVEAPWGAARSFQ